MGTGRISDRGRQEDRWMSFVDGENLTIRWQEIAKNSGISLVESSCYSKDIYVWVQHLFGSVAPPLSLSTRVAIRHYYYTSHHGDENKINLAKESLSLLDFDPVVFKKARKDQKAKGVDIALTIDMLTHAFRNNYDVAVLFTGDRDFLPLIKEVKRLGKRIYLAFFAVELTTDLRLEADKFFDLTNIFDRYWKTDRIE